MWFSSPRTFRRPAPARCLGVERLEDRCQPSAGILDPTFGTGGQVTPPFTPNSVLVQPWDGKIVLAGYTGSDMSLARYNTDGTLDTTFGSDGKEVSTIAGSTGGAAQYPQAGTANDGKIVEASGSTVARFNANGSVDTTFGKKGVVTLPWSGNIGSVVIQADGKIIISGVAGTVTTGYTFDLTRLNANGTVDTAFATKGTWAITLSGIGGKLPAHQQITGYAAMEADGKILVDFPFAYLDPGCGWFVWRFTTSGAVDTTFSTSFTGFGSAFDEPNGAALPGGFAIYPASDAADAGKILAVGYTFQVPGGPPGGATVLARYNTNGTLDATFGSGGEVIGVNNGSTVSGVAIQSDGKAIVVGTTMQRYNTNGTLDTSFGNGGIVSTAYAHVAIQSDGRIDAASATALARYLASAPQIGSFTASADPVPSGSSETLTVSGITDGNPNSSVTQVEFYYIDASGNQQVLGYGTQTSPGVWTLTFNINLSAGSYTVFAQAEDNYGVFGDPDALALQVV